MLSCPKKSLDSTIIDRFQFKYACALVGRNTPRTEKLPAETEQLLAHEVDNEVSSSKYGGGDKKLKTKTAVESEVEAAALGKLLSPFEVLRQLIRRTAFWHLTLAKALLLCVAIGSFAWMPTYYVRRGHLSIEEVN